MKTFFVIGPIGAEDSDERRRADRAMRFLIKPAIKDATGQDADQCVTRADMIAEPGRITRQIIEKLVSADVVIADVTDLNANVLYELGLRQGLLKPYVLICERNQKLPFDLADLRTVFYQLELEQVESAKQELINHVRAAVDGEVSVIDKELLEGKRGSAESLPDARSIDFQLLEANGRIISQLEQLAEKTSAIAATIDEIHKKEDREFVRQKELMEQQVGLQLFSQLLERPDQLDQTLPALQSLMEFGQKIQGHSGAASRRPKRK